MCNSSYDGWWMGCLYSRTLFLMERPLLLFRGGPNTSILWTAFFLTWSIWVDPLDSLPKGLQQTYGTIRWQQCRVIPWFRDGDHVGVLPYRWEVLSAEDRVVYISWQGGISSNGEDASVPCSVYHFGLVPYRPWDIVILNLVGVC